MSQPYSGFDPQFDMVSKPSGMSPSPAPVSAPASGMAITSLVMSILGWTFLFGLGWLVSIVTGHVALGQIRREPYRYGGRGLAIAGLVISYVSLALAALLAAVLVAAALLFVSVASRIDLESAQVEFDPSAPVAERVLAVLADQTQKPVGQITPEQSLADDLKLDELDMVELVMEIEETFGITIDDDEVERLKTVQDLIDLVERKQGPGMIGTEPVNGLPSPPE